jgi:hypothetical protein
LLLQLLPCKLLLLLLLLVLQQLLPELLVPFPMCQTLRQFVAGDP